MVDIPINEDGTRETFAETVERLRTKRKPKEIPQHYFEDTDAGNTAGKPKDIQEPETQKERFRLAAIKLAMMEDEISELMAKTPDNAFLHETREIFFYRLSNNVIDFASYAEDIVGADGQPAEVEFIDGISEHSLELGINTDRDLFIGIHADESSREAFEVYAKKNPGLANNAGTQYCFTKDGVYKKVSYIPSGVKIDPSRKPLMPLGGERNLYESEMTAGDFEIAGRALQMLKERLAPLITPKALES